MLAVCIKIGLYLRNMHITAAKLPYRRILRFHTFDCTTINLHFTTTWSSTLFLHRSMPGWYCLCWGNFISNTPAYCRHAMQLWGNYCNAMQCNYFELSLLMNVSLTFTRFSLRFWFQVTTQIHFVVSWKGYNWHPSLGSMTMQWSEESSCSNLL